jgi:DNA excision repair protein ERCC-2
MENTSEIRISVRNLVEFVLRSGDLDNRFSGGSKALEGTRAHQKLQRAYKGSYTPEVTLTHSVEYKDFIITIHGRADGVIIEDNNTIIDEIKTTTSPLDLIDEEYNHIHWAQAKCYAYIYAVQKELPQIDVQLTYYQLDSESLKKFRKTFYTNDLKEFLYDLLDKYHEWATFTRNWTIKRDLSVKQMEFPFDEYRKGQRELAVAVYKTIKEKRMIFAQAPTGIGKTISTIFPSIKALSEGATSKIFYLTAKTITRQVAENTLMLLKAEGLEFKSITLTAKDKICFKEESICNPEYCEYAKGHFDRANNAVLDILENENILTYNIVTAYAKKHYVCPFEFSLDLTLWVDAVISDYNYVFDPRVYLRRFFLDNGGDYTFLVDEAHNLVDRSRDMFSSELFKAPFVQMKKAMKDKEPKISRALGKINSYMLKVKKDFLDSGARIQKEDPVEIYPLLNKFISISEEWLKENESSEEHKKLLELYFDCIAFLRIAEFYDERYITYFEKQQNDVKVKLFCIDPSYLLSEAVKRGGATIFFSATLAPIEYFRNILGGSEGDYTIKLPSPFDPKKLCMLVADNISTKYRNREESYDAIAEYLKVLTDQKRGNYLVFFPSYKYMNEVSGRFIERYPEAAILVQSTTMLEAEKESYLQEFKPDGVDTLLGFAVLGGSFSEGIDLKGERLSGAVIISVGLPQVCLERDIIMDHFNKANGLGYEYAYMYPGMIKVMQASGRVIRSEKDVGTVLLIDERFSHRTYRQLFPKGWENNMKVRSGKQIEFFLKQFWENNK